MIPGRLLVSDCCYLCASLRLLLPVCFSQTTAICVLLSDYCYLCASLRLLLPVCFSQTTATCVLLMNDYASLIGKVFKKACMISQKYIKSAIEKAMNSPNKTQQNSHSEYYTPNPQNKDRVVKEIESHTWWIPQKAVTSVKTANLLSSVVKDTRNHGMDIPCSLHIENVLA